MGKAINRLEIWIELEATATIAGIGPTSSDSKEFYQKGQWQIPDVQIKGGGGGMWRWVGWIRHKSVMHGRSEFLFCSLNLCFILDFLVSVAVVADQPR